MKHFYLYNEINEETLKDFVEFYKTVGNNPIEIHINSAGGGVFEALGISNLLKNKNATAIIEGLCASAATIVACGCKTVKAAENALVMVHQPSVFLFSDYNSDDLSKIQGSLAAIENSILTTYELKTGKTRADFENLVRAETWLNATEAKDLGLVNEITEAVNIKNFKESKNMDEQKTETAEKKGAFKISNEILFEKYKDSVLAADRARRSELNAKKGDSAEINAILDTAAEIGATYQDVEKYINAVQNAQKNKPSQVGIQDLYNLISDNLKSGAEGVQSSTPEGNPNNADLIAKYTNEILKGGVARA